MQDFHFFLLCFHPGPRSLRSNPNPLDSGSCKSTLLSRQLSSYSFAHGGLGRIGVHGLKRSSKKEGFAGAAVGDSPGFNVGMTNGSSVVVVGAQGGAGVGEGWGRVTLRTGGFIRSMVLD